LRPRSNRLVGALAFELGEIDFDPQTWRIGQLNPAIPLRWVSAFGHLKKQIVIRAFRGTAARLLIRDLLFTVRNHFVNILLSPCRKMSITVATSWMLWGMSGLHWSNRKPALTATSSSRSSPQLKLCLRNRWPRTVRSAPKRVTPGEAMTARAEMCELSERSE
jgi:hypothetical protein